MYTSSPNLWFLPHICSHRYRELAPPPPLPTIDDVGKIFFFLLDLISNATCLDFFVVCPSFRLYCNRHTRGLHCEFDDYLDYTAVGAHLQQKYI